MFCNEEISDIIKIEAYSIKDISLSIPYTICPVVEASMVKFKGTPLVLSLKQDNSASAKSSMDRNAGGPLFTNSLSWQTDDLTKDTLEQIGTLTADPHHFLLHTYDSRRLLLYNWCSFGKTSPSDSMNGGEQSISLSFSIKSRYPLLTLI